ncbi:MAG TPA: ABC transporter substrate-binding protein [Sphingomicrobium sp.]|nr:ABC transporter substrate-binding protein [Sphingomicrobium sp.]
MVRARHIMRKVAQALVATVIGCLVLTGTAVAQRRERVVVASKIDTEGALLGHLILIALEKAGVPVENRLQLGPTKIVRTALLAGEIDLYPEYTGNGAFFFNKESDPAWKQAASAYETVSRLDREANRLVWLERAPANNTWLIAVRGDLARRSKLATMEDFASQVRERPKDIKLAGSAEFVESPAALRSFERTYDFNLPRGQVVVLPGGDTAVMMRAAAQGVSGVNAAMVYGTDGAITALDLVVMTDAKGAQIVYEPAPVARAAVLERYPAIAPALARVFASLSLEKLQKLNAQIAVEGRPPRDVASAYLQQEGLLR